MGKVTERSVRYGGKLIVYQFERKSVKNINLHVYGDGRIYVSAPYGARVKYVDELVINNAEKIEAQQNKLRAKQKLREANQIEAVSLMRLADDKVYIGEFVLPLRVVKGARNTIALREGVVIITQPDIADEKLQRELLLQFKKQLAGYLFSALVLEVHRKLQPYKVPQPILKVREMKTRWGSWNVSKYIMTLNAKLVFFPKKVIEYIIMHEFCHYFEANHSPRFYAWLAEFMPDWQERKRLLNVLNVKLG